jgi:flagellar hook assembly protein FlgD
VIPNPVRGAALVQYGLAKAGPVDVAIYSVDGRLVKTLAHGVQPAGQYRPTWDGTDAHGSPAKSGVYFVRLEAAGTRSTRLFSLMR